VVKKYFEKLKMSKNIYISKREVIQKGSNKSNFSSTPEPNQSVFPTHSELMLSHRLRIITQDFLYTLLFWKKERSTTENGGLLTSFFLPQKKY
jgi:hypothetical protein